MKGRVKWFSSEKGYGFIVGEDSIERFFGIRSIIGANLPEHLDEIEFDPYDGKKGPAAKNIRIIGSNKENKKSRDDRIVCKKCSKKSVPRLSHYGGSIVTFQTTQHICPYCGVVMYETGGGLNIIGKIGSALILLVIITEFISKIFK